MPRKSNRRQFLRQSAATSVGFWLASRPGWVEAGSPNEKLNIACVGAGGRGAGNIDGVKGEHIVALCDVDERRAAGSFKAFPKAEKFHDYRVMFDKIHKHIDAVVVSWRPCSSASTSTARSP